MTIFCFWRNRYRIIRYLSVIQYKHQQNNPNAFFISLQSNLRDIRFSWSLAAVLYCFWISIAWLLAHTISNREIVSSDELFFICIPSRSIFFSENPFGFVVAVIINFFPALAHVLILVAFTTIYVIVSTNIESMVVDISLTVALLNEQIAKKISIKEDVKLILQLHLHIYKWEKFSQFKIEPI